MTSRAFFRSNVAPRLLHRFSTTHRAVEVWTTTCIVTNFGRSSLHDKEFDHWILINPSNASLSGCRNFPYFPRGGPVPKQSVVSMHKDWQPLGYVSQWGGMEVGRGMLYPVSVVDGLVHQMGGWKLQAELQWLRMMQPSEACPTGKAVKTSAGSEPLNFHYDSIVHTTPPFFKYDEDPKILLARCYQSAFVQAFDDHDFNGHTTRAAVPLLGSGARGFPFDLAFAVAAESVFEWLLKTQQKESICYSIGCTSSPSVKQVVAFGILEEPLADQLASALLLRIDH